MSASRDQLDVGSEGGDEEPRLPEVPDAGLRLLPGEFENTVGERFDQWLARMLELSDEVLDEDERRALLYYDFVGKERRNLSTEGWRRYLRGVLRGEEWMLQWINERRPRRFCEIGAGVGTWVFLAGLAGVPEAFGVDVFSKFLRPALRMEPHFNALGYGQAKFLHQDIYDVEWDEPVDIFYMKSTIHHVLPLDRVFVYMKEHLAPGGIVVVHDPNGANPVSQVDVLKRRGLKLRESYVDEITGKTVTMANEDLLTVPGLLLRFKRHGFRIAYQQYNMGFRTRTSDAVYYNLVKPLSSSLALGAFLAPTYTIVAQKIY